MAYGTESIPAVDRIVGPGNVYVTEAKRQVAGFVGIDGLAGPSELAIVAERRRRPAAWRRSISSRRPSTTPRPRTFFLTPDAALLEKVAAAFEQELPNAGRREIVEQARAAHEDDPRPRPRPRRPHAVNDIAAEHVLLLVRRPRRVAARGSATPARCSSGHWSAVPFGDYGVASNHVLPTAGTARFSSGLRAADYVTVSSVVRMSPEAARRFTPGTSAIARAEGLVGHAQAMDARAEEADGA